MVSIITPPVIVLYFRVGGGSNRLLSDKSRAAASTDRQVLLFRRSLRTKQEILPVITPGGGHESVDSVGTIIIHTRGHNSTHCCCGVVFGGDPVLPTPIVRCEDRTCFAFVLIFRWGLGFGWGGRRYSVCRSVLVFAV